MALAVMGACLVACTGPENDPESFDRIQREALRATERELASAQAAFDRCLREHGLEPDDFVTSPNEASETSDDGFVAWDDPVQAAQLFGYGFAPRVQIALDAEPREEGGRELHDESDDALVPETFEPASDPALEQLATACQRESGLAEPPVALEDFMQISNEAWGRVYGSEQYAELLGEWQSCMANSGYRVSRPEAAARAADMALDALGQSLGLPVEIASVDDARDAGIEDEIRVLAIELFGSARSLEELVDLEVTVATADVRCQVLLSFQDVLRQEYELQVIRLMGED